MTAALGEDAFGSFLAEVARDRGIDRGGLAWIPGRPTSASVVAVDEAGERTFMHVPGTSDDLSPEHLTGVVAAWPRLATPRRVSAPTFAADHAQ
jgi:sugar/nucleoside kinase (ribokinase family)